MIQLALLQVESMSPLIGPLINLGAIGVCLIALAFWYIKKDAKADARMDERIKQEQEYRKEVVAQHEQYRKELVDLNDKYRLALGKFDQTLDSMIKLWTTRRRGGGNE